MKKLSIISLCLVAIGCLNTEQERNEYNVIHAQKVQEISEQERVRGELQSLRDEVANIQVEKAIKLGTEKYIVEIEVKQEHYNLDLGDMMKNELNKTSFSLPTSKEFYDSVKEGDILSNDFRMGSFIMNGSAGAWVITVVSKKVTT